MKFIGITGGVGAGKSEVLAYIKAHYSCEIYLADEVAHLVKEPGTECFRQLVALLGDDVVGADGQIDRLKMADRIFADAKVLEAVNEIVHPAVRAFLLDRYEAARRDGRVKLFFVEAALLIEAGYTSLVDELWYVYAPEAVRRERLRANRRYSEEIITRIMGSQLDEETFRSHSDFVIDNGGDVRETYRQIDEKLKDLK